MKNILGLMFVIAISVTTLVGQVANEPKIDSTKLETADAVLNTVSQTASTVNTVTEQFNINYGNAQEFKDSLTVVLETLPTDPQVQAIKVKTLELIQLGQEAKENKKLIYPLILGSVALLSAILGFLLSKFKRKP